MIARLNEIDVIFSVEALVVAVQRKLLKTYFSIKTILDVNSRSNANTFI